MPFILSLPREIILLVLEYLDYLEQLYCTCSCTEWYDGLMRNHIRRITIRNDWTCQQKLASLIANPFHQLSIIAPESILEKQFKRLLKRLNYCVSELTVNEMQFHKLMKLTDRISLKKLSVRINKTTSSTFLDWITSQNIGNSLDCSHLSLSIAHFRNSHKLEIIIPYFFGLRTHTPSQIRYLSSLCHLSLCDCGISDVSMLGSIPHLELISCNKLVDISSLNNNDHVIVRHCRKIRSYCHSFANSRKIEIIITRKTPNQWFNTTNWSKLEELVFIAYLSALFVEKISLPHTMKRCHLEGNFIYSINSKGSSKVTADHALRELKLSCNDAITGLNGYGLERVAIIELHNLRFLSSLQGLGRGRNHKIRISQCPQVQDFSPLNHIPTVEIKNCDGFRDPLPLSGFTMSSSNSMVSQGPSPSIRSLTLSKNRNVKHFHGLEKIPFLQLDSDGYELIKNFLEVQGMQLQNQQIVLYGDDLNLLLSAKLIELHYQFMTAHYDYYQPCPRKWIWIRHPGHLYFTDPQEN